MSRKPLVIIEQDEEMKGLMAEMEKSRDMFKEAQEFSKKQLEASWTQIIGSQWERIENALKARGLLAEGYSRDNNGGEALVMSDGVIYLEDKASEGGILSMLRGLGLGPDA
jgi:hypothetical protein